MNFRTTIAAVAVTSACLAAGCNKVTYLDRSTMPDGKVHEQTGHFFILGLAGTADVPAGTMCPTGVSKIQSKFTFGDLVLTVLTAGIYTPRTYEISCGTGGAQ